MKKILLCCSAGMSTSLLVKKMIKEADDRGLELEIVAYPMAEFETEVASCDVCLLGPQVRYKLNEFKTYAAEHNVEVAAIDPMAYGTMNASKILDSVLKMMAS